MRRIPKLLQMIGLIFLIYFSFIILFDYILDQVIPSSLLNMYMFFIVAGVLAVYTSTEQGTREILEPITALVEDPEQKQFRNIVFVLLPIIAGIFTFSQLTPGVEAPVELRSIHPAPPSSLKMFGKYFNMLTLENPYRKLEKDDPASFREMVKEGERVYFQDCHFCHGAKLDGQGPYATGLNPTPLNFQDIGTIAQLQESYLFWRISTGGPGLPNEAAPWISSMPAWEEYLTEEEVWQVILFLYDYTGQRPRSLEG